MAGVLDLLVAYPVIRRAKYGNKKSDSSLIGRRFDSAGERARAEELSLLEKAGAIRNLRYQVTFRLDVKGVHITNYRADFTYEEVVKYGYVRRMTGVATDGVWVPIVEDFKGMVTEVYKIKRALMLAVHGITIRETYAKGRKR